MKRGWRDDSGATHCAHNAVMALSSKELSDAGTDTVLDDPDGSSVRVRFPLASTFNRKMYALD